MPDDATLDGDDDHVLNPDVASITPSETDWLLLDGPQAGVHSESDDDDDDVNVDAPNNVPTDPNNRYAPLADDDDDDKQFAQFWWLQRRRHHRCLHRLHCLRFRLFSLAVYSISTSTYNSDDDSDYDPAANSAAAVDALVPAASEACKLPDSSRHIKDTH